MVWWGHFESQNNSGWKEPVDSKLDQDAQDPVQFISLQVDESCVHSQEQQWPVPDITVFLKLSTRNHEIWQIVMYAWIAGQVF